MNLYINELKNKEVITSYNFARNSDNVFSEVITKDKFDLLDNKSKLFKISETENQILYINSEFKVTENDVIFCNTYFVKDLFSKLKNINNLKNLKLITSQTDHSITNELITSHPKVAAPTTRKPSLLPKFVAFKIKVDPKNERTKKTKRKIPVNVKLDDNRVLIISRIRCHSSQIIYNQFYI